MIGKLLVLGILITSTAGLECWYSKSPFVKVHLEKRKSDSLFAYGRVGGGGQMYPPTQNMWNMKNQLNNGELEQCDTRFFPRETTICAKQHSSVDGLVQRSEKNVY